MLRELANISLALHFINFCLGVKIQKKTMVMDISLVRWLC